MADVWSSHFSFLIFFSTACTLLAAAPSSLRVLMKPTFWHFKLALVSQLNLHVQNISKQLQTSYISIMSLLSPMPSFSYVIKLANETSLSLLGQLFSGVFPFLLSSPRKVHPAGSLVSSEAITVPSLRFSDFSPRDGTSRVLPVARR